jgi:hypothetical protein
MLKDFNSKMLESMAKFIYDSEPCKLPPLLNIESSKRLLVEMRSMLKSWRG